MLQPRHVIRRQASCKSSQTSPAWIETLQFRPTAWSFWYGIELLVWQKLEEFCIINKPGPPQFVNTGSSAKVLLKWKE